MKRSDLPTDKVNMLQYLEHKVHCFKAGGLREYYNQWQALTSDPEILQMILGQPIEFTRTPYQRVFPKEKKILDLDEQYVIDTEIDKLLAKGVLTPSSHEEGEYISPIFTRAKKDGSFRVILNLKCLNTHVQYHHFKIDSLNTVLHMVKPGCFMASIDLKDAFYSVPIATADQKYLKFQWRGKLYKYVCFPNGLAFCPRKFTKLLKPVYSHLRQLGHLSASHIDDSYLQGDDYDDCERNVWDTVNLFDSLGFTVHPEKSSFVPQQRITFMGFIIDSITMTVYPTSEKIEKIIHTCQGLLQCPHPTIREVASTLGLLISNFPAAQLGPLHFRSLDMDKTEALRLNKGNFDAFMQLSELSRNDLQWWVNSARSLHNPISLPQPEITLYTDASKGGWGGVLNNVKIGGIVPLKKLLITLIILKCLQCCFLSKHFIKNYQGSMSLCELIT